MQKMLCSVFLIPLLLSACGGTTLPAGGDGGAGAPSIAGTWRSACVPDGQGGSLSLTFDIDTDHWALDYATFGGEACGTPGLTVQIEGPYVVEGASPVVEGAFEAEFGFSSKRVIAHSEQTAAFLNGLESCGESEFVVGVATDIGGSGCAPLGQRPIADCPADHDLVSVADGSLRFGERPADNDMCTPTRRPMALSGLALALIP